MSAIKRVVKFAINLYGDGAATTIDILLVGAPIWFQPPSGGDIPQETFDLATLKPTDVKNVISTGPDIASATITALGTKLSIEFASAPAATPIVVSGVFEF